MSTIRNHVEVFHLAVNILSLYLLKDPAGHPIREGNGVSFRIALNLADLYPANTDFINAEITHVVCERTGGSQDYMDWTGYPVALEK